MSLIQKILCSGPVLAAFSFTSYWCELQLCEQQIAWLNAAKLIKRENI